MSLKSGKFPEIWKLSYIKPIFKAGHHSKVENYRGVCNQSVVPKILDSIVAKQLQWMASRILTVHQHGFCKNKSTLSNLLEYYSYLNDAFANRN